MSGWSIRLARMADASEFPSIESAAATLYEVMDGLAGLASAEPLSKERYAAMIRQGHSLTAQDAERIVGFAATERHGRELHLREMSVHPDRQRAGIGQALLRGLEIDARNSGFRAITLTTFADIAWNAPFYERLGYACVTDLAAHPRLAAELDRDAEDGLPADRRCAMIRFL